VQQTQSAKMVMFKKLTGGFPDSEEVVLRFENQYQVTTTTTTLQYIVIAGNGCFDPDVYASTVQPNNWDDWSVQYSRYLPMSARCEVKCRNIGLSNATIPVPAPAQVVFGPDNQDASSTSATVSGSLSRPRYKAAYVSSTGTTRLRATASAQQLKGYTPAQMQGFDIATAAVGANPTSLWYFNLIFYGVNATATVTAVDIRVDYTVRFYSRISQDLDLVTRAGLLTHPVEKKSLPGIVSAKSPVHVSGGSPSSVESKGDFKSLGFKELTLTSGKSTTSESKTLSGRCATQAKELVIVDDVLSLGDEDDDEDEAAFIAYLKWKRDAKSKLAQAHAVENSDFSGLGMPFKKPGAGV
jgi:hypothetical protein